MKHACHAIDCKKEIKPELFMCWHHWRMLPNDVQRRVYNAYRPGQCKDWKPSAAYCDIAADAVRRVADREGKTVTGDEIELQLYRIFRLQDENKVRGQECSE